MRSCGDNATEKGRLGLPCLDSLLLSRWRSGAAHGSFMNLNILLGLKRPPGSAENI